MLTLIALVFAFTQDRDKVAEAAGKNTQELSSYKFNVEYEVQGFGGGNNRESPKIEGTFHKDEGLHVRIGDAFEVVKRGKKIAHVDAERNWRILDDKPPAEGNDRDRRRRDWQQQMFRNIKAPHEELKGIEGKFKDVKKAEDGERVDDQECVVYAGELTPEGARDLIPNRGMLQRAENLELKGTGRLWVNDKGVVVKYQIAVEASGEFRNNSFTVNLTRTVLLSQLNEARSEIPEEARKLLDAGADAPKDEK
jgi:hypothetical protein